MQSLSNKPLFEPKGKMSFCVSNMMLTGCATPYFQNGCVRIVRFTFVYCLTFLISLVTEKWEYQMRKILILAFLSTQKKLMLWKTLKLEQDLKILPYQFGSSAPMTTGECFSVQMLTFWTNLPKSMCHQWGEIKTDTFCLDLQCTTTVRAEIRTMRRERRLSKWMRGKRFLAWKSTIIMKILAVKEVKTF